MSLGRITITYKKENPLDVEYLAKQFHAIFVEPENAGAAATHTTRTRPVYNPFHIRNIQNYNPIYSRFFDLNEQNFNKITLNQQYGFRDGHLVDRQTGETHETPIFFKFAPLLDPIRYMIGKYDYADGTIKNLPTIHTPNDCYPKLADPNNVSYVDSFFCYLSSQLLAKHNVFNAVDFYGSYLGIQELFRVDISDELEYLNSSPFYTQHLNRDFYADCHDYLHFSNGSKTNRQRIKIQESSRSSQISLGEECISADMAPETDEPGVSPDTVYEKTASDHNNKTAASVRSSKDSMDSNDLNYSSEEDGEDDSNADDVSFDLMNESDEDEETESDEADSDIIYAYIRDFPTQMICLEKCSGVLDQLLEDEELDEQKMKACLFQVIMTLLIYHRAFHFTHNDLHTNNIMYTNTDAKFVYYKYRSKYYRVPTYGRIFKIIDFGRAIYRFRGELFCSDSFAKCGDAYSQYNCEPYLNPNKPRIDPNPSFDLCRLGCSMYDFAINLCDSDEEELTPLQETIANWCTDDNGKNVLYKKNMDERYPGFKLYKMISRNVHHHTPDAQLQNPVFNQFGITQKKFSKTNVGEIAKYFTDIDSIPCYVNVEPAVDSPDPEFD
jgi:hypothetical protein